MISHTLFISDLHLEAGRPEITKLFLRFLKENLPKAEALYILGDFFEVWVGDDDKTPFNEMIKSSLKEMTQQGHTIYFMHGNRDLLIGRRFLRDTGCKLIKDPSVINLYGQPTLLMHGDSLCTKDIKHMAFRRKSKSKLRQTLFLMKPLKSRIAMAREIRKRSKEHTSTAPDNIMDVTSEEVQRVMQTHGVTQLIHGHTHRPNVHTVILNQGTTGKRIVLGAWDTSVDALIYYANGSYKRLTNL